MRGNKYEHRTNQKYVSFRAYQYGPVECECGKTHSVGTRRCIIESGAIRKLPALLAECGSKKPFILSGHDTFAAAGEKVTGVLKESGIPYSSYVFLKSPVTPTEHSVGSAVMHFDYSCDAVIGIGSGVINDIGKYWLTRPAEPI